MPRPTRDPKLEQFWRRHLRRQSASGRTIRDYCREHGLREPSFYAWRRSIRQRDHSTPCSVGHTVSPSTPPAFLPVAIVDSRPHHQATPIDIHIANGCRIRVRSGCDRVLLAEVLAILRPAPQTEARPC